MISVALIVVGGLAFTVVMKAIAIDALAIMGQRAELAASSAISSGIAIAGQDMRRHGPDRPPPEPPEPSGFLDQHNYLPDGSLDPNVTSGYASFDYLDDTNDVPGWRWRQWSDDPFCDEGCWAVEFTQRPVRDVNLRGAAANTAAVPVWATTIYAVADCRASVDSAVQQLGPPSVVWSSVVNMLDCRITDTATVGFEADSLPLYTLIISEWVNPCDDTATRPAGTQTDKACGFLVDIPEATQGSAQSGALVLDTAASNAAVSELCGEASSTQVNVGSAAQSGVDGVCGALGQDQASEITWTWDFDLDNPADDLSLGEDPDTNDITDNACNTTPAPDPVLYSTVTADWDADTAMFTTSPDWTTGDLS